MSKNELDINHLQSNDLSVGNNQWGNMIYTPIGAGIVSKHKTYVNKNITWEKERTAARIIMMLIFLSSLYLATFAKPAMVIFSGIAISIAFQFLIVLLGLIWFPWITRGAATFGLIEE